jgi:signal peptidase II
MVNWRVSPERLLAPPTSARYGMLLVLLLLTAVTGLGIDQFGKGWAFGSWGGPHGIREIVPGLYAGVQGRNEGAMFSVEGHGSRLVCWTLTLAGAVAIGWLLRWAVMLDRDRWRGVDAVGGGLLVAGALGNQIDRVVLGYARDFLVLSLWPHGIFNTADLLMVAGALILLVSLASGRRRFHASSA